jgi:hypothetical protein
MHTESLRAEARGFAVAGSVNDGWCAEDLARQQCDLALELHDVPLQRRNLATVPESRLPGRADLASAFSP